MVLINESDFVVTFGSTVTKECVMLSKPFVNIDMKKFKHLDFLKSSSCIRIEEESIRTIDYESFIENIFEITKRDNSQEFYDLRSKYLFNETIGNVSKKLLDFCDDNVK